jgi:RNA polymerase sigma factor (sigma-70 family)
MSDRIDHDRPLMELYDREGSEAAFADLVHRHIDLVWGAAFRVSGDSELARDVAQTVFSDLARKARFFPSAATIPGWLYRAALLAARKAVRTNARRSRREKEAMDNISQLSETSFAVDQLLPLLDEGLQTLPQKDRDAVVLRFFARKSLAEIGGTFAISEDAAQKRVTRALERLKSYFQRRGHIVPVGAVLAALSAAGAVAAPAGLAGTVAGLSCAAVTTGWLATTTSFLSGTGQQIVLMKTKIAIASLAAVAVSSPLVLQHKTLASLQRDHAEIMAATRDLDTLRGQAGQSAVQRQFAADWAQHQRDLDELRSLREESKRLADAAAANPGLHQRLLAARKNHEAATATAALANETLEAEVLKVRTVQAMKHLGLAARIFATDNKDHFPKSFQDMTNELGTNQLPGDMPLDRFEFAQHEREIFETEPQLILFREKEPRRLPDGKWTRAYTLADGSVQNPVQDTPDFSEWEKPFIARNPEQASR